MSVARIVIWADVEQEALIRDAIQAGSFEPVAIGSPNSDDGAALSERFGVPRLTDLREAIGREPSDHHDLLWLAAPRSLHADERKLIRDVGRPTVASEPRPGGIAEVLADPTEAATARFVPLMRRSPGFCAAHDMLQQFGDCDAVNIAMRSSAPESTLFGRLFDAMDLLDTLCGQAEVIDATLVSSPGDRGDSGDVPESLRGLHGHMSINVRFGRRRCAAITISDAAGCWFRGLTIVGNAGTLRITDSSCQWISPGGEILDAHDEDQACTPGGLIGLHARRILDKLDAHEPPPDNARLLALCEAARLSCRTGQGESPHRMMEMLRHP